MGPASSVRRNQTELHDDEELERKRRASEALEKYAKEYTAARGGKLRQKSSRDTVAGAALRTGSGESSDGTARQSKLMAKQQGVCSAYVAISHQHVCGWSRPVAPSTQRMLCFAWQVKPRQTG